jgi:hypothetical protein
MNSGTVSAAPRWRSWLAGLIKAIVVEVVTALVVAAVTALF